MKRNNKTAAIADILNKSMFNGIGMKSKMDNVIKHSTIFSFWNNIAGIKFSRNTKPYAIKGNKLYISVESPVIAQELNLYKLKLLKKVNFYSVPLGVEIKDIVFNYKNYNDNIREETALNTSKNSDLPAELSEDELKNTILNEELKNEFKDKTDKIKFLNKQQKERFLSKLLNTKRAQILQNKNSKDD